MTIAPEESIDFSRNFGQLRTKILEQNSDYRQFIQTLTPRYWVVWVEIGLGYLGIMLVLLGGYHANQYPLPSKVASGVFGAILVGFLVHYLILFHHEASHYLLHKQRKTNDILGDIVLSWLAGRTLETYRKAHFKHHQVLGQRDDPENSYFYALSIKNIFLFMSGLHTVRLVAGQKTEGGAVTWPVLVGSALIHLVICVVFATLGYWNVAASWFFGVGLVFPFFNIMRAILEHRHPLFASTEKNWQTQTKMFAHGWFAALFGGAGFRRHLLHHWEPQVSYTRFDALEAYLEKTVAKGVLQRRRTTYFRTLLDLLREPWK